MAEKIVQKLECPRCGTKGEFAYKKSDGQTVHIYKNLTAGFTMKSDSVGIEISCTKCKILIAKI